MSVRVVPWLYVLWRGGTRRVLAAGLALPGANGLGFETSWHVWPFDVLRGGPRRRRVGRRPIDPTDRFHIG